MTVINISSIYLYSSHTGSQDRQLLGVFKELQQMEVYSLISEFIIFIY